MLTSLVKSQNIRMFLVGAVRRINVLPLVVALFLQTACSSGSTNSWLGTIDTLENGMIHVKKPWGRDLG